MFFRGISIKDQKSVILKSIAFSYLINILVEKFKRYNENSVLAFNLYLIVFSVFISYISYLLIEDKELKNILNYFGISTSTSLEEIAVLKGNEKNTFLRIYLKNQPYVYEGFLSDHEVEACNDTRFLTLMGYKQYEITKDSDYYNETIIQNKNYSEQYEEKVLIYFKDIERIEKCNIERIRKQY